MNNQEMAFGDRLRRLRKFRELSQEALALRLGWSGQSRIANYEANTREPTFEENEQLAQALDAPISALLEDDALERFISGPKSSRLSRLDIDNILDAVRDATDGGKKLTAERFSASYEAIRRRSEEVKPVADLSKKRGKGDGAKQGRDSGARPNTGRATRRG